MLHRGRARGGMRRDSCGKGIVGSGLGRRGREVEGNKGITRGRVVEGNNEGESSGGELRGGE